MDKPAKTCQAAMRTCRGGDIFNLTEFGLSESGLYRLIHLNIWSPAGGTVWEETGSVTLLEEVHH